jgi:hypothetical protein
MAPPPTENTMFPLQRPLVYDLPGNNPYRKIESFSMFRRWYVKLPPGFKELRD